MVWLTVLVVGTAPVQFGSVTVLVDWLLAPLRVELCCLPFRGCGFALVLGLVWSWYVSFPDGLAFYRDVQSGAAVFVVPVTRVSRGPSSSMWMVCCRRFFVLSTSLVVCPSFFCVQ